MPAEPDRYPSTTPGSPANRPPLPASFPDDTQPFIPLTHRPARRVMRWLLLMLAALALIAAAGLMLTLTLSNRPLAVTLDISSDSATVRTSARTVSELLSEQGIALDAGDIVQPGPETPLSDGMTVEVQRARTVSVTVDGVTSVIRTTLDAPLDILSGLTVSISGSDRVYLDGTEITSVEMMVAWPVPVTHISILRTVPLIVYDDEREIRLNTTAATVGDALFDAGIDLYLADAVTPDVSAATRPDMEIRIDRARELTLVVDGARIATRTGGATVADALAGAGVSLDGLDYTIPATTTPIVPGMDVRVIRVTEEIITEQEEVPFETVFQADADLALDNRRVLQAGQRGVFQRTLRVRYENGIEIRREIEDETLLQEPRNQIIGYGTQVIVRTLDTPDGPVEYWRRLRMYATSYYPAQLGSNTTSIGMTLRTGIIAIDPRIIPYRTNLYVPGYGQGIAADTGGPRSTPYWVDLGYSDEEWIPWSRWVEVYVLTPVPDNIDYLLPDVARGGPLP